MRIRLFAAGLNGYNGGVTTAVPNIDLWSLVRGAPPVDPVDLLAAIEREMERPPHDFRTRLLIRDSYRALEHHFGTARLRALISAASLVKLEPILAEPLGEVGFPSLERRLMEKTEPDAILEFLRELGSRIQQPVRLDIGGSSSLILAGLLSRATEDINVVDQVPQTIRTQHELLSQLAHRYELQLAHFQSRDLPAGWPGRVRSLGQFGKLDVYLIDASDIFIGKLFSNREKDRDDLRQLKRSLDKTILMDRLRISAQALLAEAPLRENAGQNWHILFGEPLPC